VPAGVKCASTDGVTIGVQVGGGRIGVDVEVGRGVAVGTNVSVGVGDGVAVGVEVEVAVAVGAVGEGVMVTVQVGVGVVLNLKTGQATSSSVPSSMTISTMAMPAGINRLQRPSRPRRFFDKGAGTGGPLAWVFGQRVADDLFQVPRQARVCLA